MPARISAPKPANSQPNNAPHAPVLRFHRDRPLRVDPGDRRRCRPQRRADLPRARPHHVDAPLIMGEIVNLRSARKARARREAETTAAANRAKHGRTKAEKTRDAAEAARRESILDGAARE